MKIEEKFNLITRNLQEIISKDELMELLKREKEISIYWGTTPTGSISVAYFFPMLKIADFLKADLKVKILLADLHASLDGIPWNLLDRRTNYYKGAIIKILKVIGVNIEKLEFVRGRDIQLNGKYFENVLKLSSVSTIRNCNKAASEVVKMTDNPLLGNLIYPIMQAVDEEHLGVHIQFGGVDQRKIMVYARENLVKIGFKPRIELMSPIIRGLVGEKMSSSVKSSKIDLFDNEVDIKKKISGAECIFGDTNNGVMSLLRYLIMILKEDKNEEFLIERDEKFGGNIKYKNYLEIERDFKSKKLHPVDLKNSVSKELNILLKKFREDEDLLNLYKKAYE